MDINKELTELKLKITPISTAKFVAGSVISFGAMAAVTAALKGTTASTRGLTKIMMKLGIFFLGCKAGDIAEKYFSEAFDQVLDALKETREEMEHEPDTDKQ